jgi:hypothetical protein
VNVRLDDVAAQRLEKEWGHWVPDVPLIFLESPYRSLLGPLTEYVDRVCRETEGGMVTVLLPEFVPAKWWHNFLHNQSALVIKGAMLFRERVVVVSVPYHLKA